MYGLSVEEATASVPLWPDNVNAYNVFTRMLTQWRSGGIDGAGNLIYTGLDYASLPQILLRCKISDDNRDDTFDALQVMEDAALDKMRADRANRK